jgi:hypothetical protein
MSANEIIAIAAVGTLLVTAMAVLVTLKGVRDELWLQTFAEYTRRYVECVRELPPEARDPAADFALDALEGPERHRILNAARLYVNLCSEEHYLHDRKRIDSETWDIWALGMRDAFRLPWFRSAWRALRHEYEPYIDFCIFFDDCLRTSDPAQPVDSAEGHA